MLLPINVVLINQEGWALKNESILPDTLPWLFLSSISSLSEEMNAISMPEKKAESTSEINMMVKKVGSIMDELIYKGKLPLSMIAII
jgi:hypothetical protein